MAADRFPEFTIRGSADERGLSHGTQLRDRIQQTIDVYTGIFKKTRDEIFERARHFRSVITDYHADYAGEIEAIAAGAQVDPLWIYALNSRSELLTVDTTPDINECTALYFRPTSILAQNWDWVQPMEELVVLMRIEQPSGPSILMLSEPGIIGKIGFNSAGIGTCLNILFVDKPLDGVPIHIALRSILDCTSIDDACDAVERVGLGKASNILFGNGAGQCRDVEFAGDRRFVLDPPEDIVVHTNHYLAERINPESELFLSSYCRQRVATEKSGDVRDHSFDEMNHILTDRTNKLLPIHRPYGRDEMIGEIGTVATLIMELNEQRLHVRKGNANDARFHMHSLS